MGIDIKVEDRICDIVSDAIDKRRERNENWADAVDIALIDAGFEVVLGELDGSDPWEIAVVEIDGQWYTVYLSDESATGRYKYAISEREIK